MNEGRNHPPRAKFAQGFRNSPPGLEIIGVVEDAKEGLHGLSSSEVSQDLGGIDQEFGISIQEMKEGDNCSGISQMA